jgi:hypothetical protein
MELFEKVVLVFSLIFMCAVIYIFIKTMSGFTIGLVGWGLVVLTVRAATRTFSLEEEW